MDTGTESASGAAAAPAPASEAAAAPAPVTVLTLTPPLRLDTSILPTERAPCPKCSRKRFHYCGEDLVAALPPGSTPLPTVRLPLKLHVLRGKENPEKATGAHAVLLAPEDASIHYLPALPPYADPSRVLLLYPSPTSTAVSEVDPAEFDTLLIVDCTYGGPACLLPHRALAPFFLYAHLFIPRSTHLPCACSSWMGSRVFRS